LKGSKIAKHQQSPEKLAGVLVSFIVLFEEDDHFNLFYRLKWKNKKNKGNVSLFFLVLFFRFLFCLHGSPSSTVDDFMIDHFNFVDRCLCFAFFTLQLRLIPESFNQKTKKWSPPRSRFESFLKHRGTLFLTHISFARFMFLVEEIRRQHQLASVDRHEEWKVHSWLQLDSAHSS
jgi:hypothetical protein